MKATATTLGGGLLRNILSSSANVSPAGVNAVKSGKAVTTTTASNLTKASTVVADGVELAAAGGNTVKSGTAVANKLRSVKKDTKRNQIFV